MLYNIELSKEDLISMVQGTVPNYSLFDHPLIKTIGYYTGGFVDKWTWIGPALKQLSEESLMTVYKLCKESWK